MAKSIVLCQYFRKIANPARPLLADKPVIYVGGRLKSSKYDASVQYPKLKILFAAAGAGYREIGIGTTALPENFSRLTDLRGSGHEKQILPPGKKLNFELVSQSPSDVFTENMTGKVLFLNGRNIGAVSANDTDNQEAELFVLAAVALAAKTKSIRAEYWAVGYREDPRQPPWQSATPPDRLTNIASWTSMTKIDLSQAQTQQEAETLLHTIRTTIGAQPEPKHGPGWS